MRLTTAGVALLLLVFYTNNPSDAWTHSFHTGPINCYNCSSTEECAASAGKLKKCENNDAQSCMAIIDEAGTVIRRGCSDNLQESCTFQPCYECRSHGCNNLKDNKKLIDCWVCDAELDENCVFDTELITQTRQCNEQCITALYPRTKDAGAPLELVRTCLDDLDLDDREACVDGTLDNCAACSTAKCNSVEMGVRGSCNVCTDGNCDNPQSKTCRAVAAKGEKEHCFIQLDEAGKIAELGCLSQYNVSDVAVLQSEKRLWLCSGENCNVISALPTAQKCKICSSRTDPNCAIAPTMSNSETECSHMLNTDCYTLLRDDGHTERGCLASLDAEDYVECLGGSNATKCVTCQGDNCNVKVQPEDRLTCHVCSSDEDENCEREPDAEGLCVVHRPGQMCVTAIDLLGNTLRGCGDSLSCVTNDTNSCQSCLGKNCNTVNLKRRADGQPGLWGQHLPLSCRSCNDTATCASSTPTHAVCSGKDEYCMTVFDATGKVEARGCSQVVEASFSTYCDANTGKCHNCNSNGCNNAASIESYTSCVYCEASSNSYCYSDANQVSTRRQCNGKCMTALRPINGTDSYDLVRGCLDDKEPQDQELCDSDKDCIACEGDACNVHEIKVDRLSCYVCKDTVDCEVAAVAACPNYSPTDRCYTLYDDTASVTAKGCLSSHDDKFIDDNIEFLHICDGNSCNSYENVPKPTKCSVCSSADDENCAVDPSKITQYESCNVLPNTGCMTRVLTDGSTQRGCVSSLASSPLRACLKGEGTCDVCEGEMCNQHIYPADRRRCQRCNSKDDPTCASLPNAGSVCPRYDETQGCSAKLVSGAIYRDCQTEFKCDDSDKQYCRQCLGKDNCNVVDLDLLNIGYPGKWATPPVNCYTCEGVDCQGSSLGSLHKCANNDRQNCATVFASNGSVVLRGCSDKLYNDTELTQYCDETPGSCKFCKSTGCNNAKTLDSFVDCLLCDGSDQASCVLSVGDITRKTSCHGSCFTGLYPRSKVEEDSALEMARGCLDDLEHDDREACVEGKLDNCVACSGAACNKDEVPKNRLSCNYCVDAECEEIKSQTCTAYRNNDQCYIHVDHIESEIESMGCASDLERSFMQTNRRDLYLCSDSNCNTKDVLNLEPHMCHICNSTWDPGCASGNTILTVQCQHLLDSECYTHITKEGVIKRGCLMDVADELYDDCTSGASTTCEICDTDRCNSEVYPSDWLTCLRCDSNKDADCEKDPSSYSKYCAIYEAGDSCVTSLEKGRTRRGCKSELYCDPSQVASCRYCEGKDCNTVDLAANHVGEPGKWQDLPLSCHVCSDVASCATLGTPTTCEGNNKQLCSTVFDENGKVTARGCSDSILSEHSSYCDANGANCQQCKSNGCNNADSLDSFVECYYCDADQDPSCAWEQPKKTRHCQGQCMTGMYPRSSSPDSALLPTRGCVDDLEEADQKLCAEGKLEHCKVCSEGLCNGGDIVETPQECFQCATEECVDMISAKCVAYKEKHQCYTAFQDNSIVYMGCASDFESQVIDELVAQKRLLVCDGQNCNNPAVNVPQPNTCLQCSSLNDTRCASNPNQLLSTDICSDLPYTQCVTHIDAAGVTTRGCLSSLDGAEFTGCLAGSSSLCEICTGTNCNGLTVFPANRRRCHQCDSKSTHACATSPSSSSVCPVYDAEDSCVTTLINDVTHRGCSSSLSCEDATDSSTCRVCSGEDSCNTVDLERLNVHGTPGTWQETPIKCLACASAEECTNGGGSLKECVGKDNCVTVFDESDAVTSRSCYGSLDSTAASYCDEQPENCPRCNSNGCNLADTLKSYMECLVCDSALNSNCVNDVAEISKTRQCYKGCITALRPLFNESSDPSYALVRNCQDDLEAEDSATCESKKLCSPCNTAKCNTNDVVASRLSCLSCHGDECQNPQPASCATYRPEDQCYIQLDESRSVVAHGCLSEFSHEDIYLLKRAQRLLTCKDKDCNTAESVPNPQSCLLCSSRTDRNCAVNPGAVTSETTCSLLGFPECYSRVLEDGSTERGCLSSLEDDQFLSCYNGTASGCSSCLGDSCNKLVYPTDRTSCHICSSESDGNCESFPNSLSVCPIYAAGDSCVTNLRSDVTYRGCASSISCEPNSKSCVYCEGDGCNVVDLSVFSDDNHGKWQDLPLTCLSCKDAECQQASINSERCADNNEQDCVTVFNDKGVVIRRGCEDEIAQEQEISTYCGTNTAKCPVCKSNNCNNATDLAQYKSCIYCDSYKDLSCLWEPTSSKHKRRHCQGSCMTALHGAEESGFDLTRTCLDDKETADQDRCLAGEDSTCVACSGDACNVQTLPAERLSCYHCEHGDCEVPTTKLCDVYKPDDSCFLWIDNQNSIYQLGCLSSFRNQDEESVIKTKRISVCQGSNCNTPQLPASVKCAVCDSRVNATCATTPLAVDHFEICSQLPHTHCVTQLDKEGATIRGCLFDVPQAEYAACLLGNDPNCQVCQEGGCNREIFPADRQRCYSCSSADDSKCESDPSQTSVCAWVSDTEKCQTHLENSVTTRGCSSSVQCDTNDYRNCRNCVGSGCNSIDLANRKDDGQHGLFQPLPLKCHTCEGEHCHSSLGPAAQCTLNAEQDCKTVFELDGETVRRRGCADDVDDYEDLYCRQHPELCFTCKSNECNDAWKVADYTSCLYCNSETEGQCVTYPQSTDVATRQCQGKCLVALLDNKQLVRSCLDDKEALDRAACTSDASGKNCATCENGKCNTFSFPADRLSCHVCTASGCSSSRAEPCIQYDDKDFCFAKYKDGAVELMGCATSQNDTDLEQWRLSNVLYECRDKDCNDLSRLPASGVCIDCDSSKTPNCAQSPKDVDTTVTCHAPLSDCVTRLDNGHTIRGCLSSLSSADGNACVANGTCASCAGDKCNTEVFPASRRKCHICNSVANSDCAEEPNHLAICPVYAADDTCVTSFGSDKFLQRGCGSQLECEIDDKDHCQVCSTDGCNTAKFNGSAALRGVGLALTLVVSLAISSMRW